MTGEGWQASEDGSPQGGVISPLVANVYLDAFDQFMKGRGHRIVRYADDILILTRSKSAAHNALTVAGNYLEGELLLTVNERKSKLQGRELPWGYDPYRLHPDQEREGPGAQGQGEENHPAQLTGEFVLTGIGSF
jgi:hypothetical protein